MSHKWFCFCPQKDFGYKKVKKRKEKDLTPNSSSLIGFKAWLIHLLLKDDSNKRQLNSMTIVLLYYVNKDQRDWLTAKFKK
jgi:hypothetical protein